MSYLKILKKIEIFLQASNKPSITFKIGHTFPTASGIFTRRKSVEGSESQYQDIELVTNQQGGQRLEANI